MLARDRCHSGRFRARFGHVGHRPFVTHRDPISELVGYKMGNAVEDVAGDETRRKRTRVADLRDWGPRVLARAAASASYGPGPRLGSAESPR